VPLSEGTGRVFLVGAGPGDPELITLKGLRRLRQADAVVYDRLVAPELVDEAPSWAERVFVGKEEGRHTLPQEEINELLIRLARSGRQVVRLKGGDPFVFGRGGEEAQACAEAGVPFEVVPGVSSAVAAPASAGIPVTHRGVASWFAVITAHGCGPAASQLPDWRSLQAVETLVILMGVKRLPEVTRGLIESGRSPETPAAVVERGTQAGERVVTGTLETLAARAAEAEIASPATIVVGEVVRLRESLCRFPSEGHTMGLREASDPCPAGAPVSASMPVGK
jgi:uroporphyrin-III C-methyltransferase